MKNIKKFNEINEGFFSNLAKKFINNWEKLAIYKVSSPYVRSTFGIATDRGVAKGHLIIYVEREKNKVKAVADYSIATQEYDIDTVYMEDPKLEKIVDWAFSTDPTIPLKDLIKEKYGTSVIGL